MRYILVLIGLLWVYCASAQSVSFDFEVSNSNGYGDDDYGEWYAANSQVYGSGKQYNGNKALVFDDDAGAYLLYEGSDGSGKDGGVGTISFYYRHWDGDGKSVKFKVQYDNGSGWTDVGSEISATSTSYTAYNETINISGDDILVRVLSTAYSERLLIDDIVITGYGGSGGGSTQFTISDDGSLNESLENGELITIKLLNDTFADPLDMANWSIYNAPQGVGKGILTRINDTTATLSLSGKRTADYDTDITNFTLEIDHAELDNLSSGSASVSTGVTFIADDDAESLSMTDDGQIVEGSEDGELITLYIHGGTFVSAFDMANWSLNNAPSGIGIQNLTRVNDTTATFALDGNSTTDYDVDITTLEIEITEDEMDDLSSGTLSIDAGVTFTALIEAAPLTQASGIQFDDVGATSIELSWTRGDGEYCLVLIHEGVAVDALPVNDSVYTAHTTYGNGDELGSANYVVYKGTSNTVEVTGLTQGEEYHFRVYEFNNQGLQTRYLTTSATLNPASSFTSPNNVDDFTLECISTNSVHLSWTPPTGSYDGVVIAMRESTLSVHTLSGNGNNYIASSVFGSGTSFGSTTPKSYVVYKGTGSSVTVSGLTPGASYTFKAIVYKDSLWSGGRTKSARVAEIEEVDNLSHYAPDQKLHINWTNPVFHCPDEVMVVVKSGIALTRTPSGDGSAYTASTLWGSGTDLGGGEYVVYKGQDDEVEISGLTNGTTYHFSIFVRDDTVWSDGVSGSNTPDDISILFQGDLAVLAVNTGNSSNVDEISIVCFDTLKTGSSIDITDNGWEREYADYWGTTEGVIRFTRTGPDVLPGEVFTFTGQGHSSSDFDAYGLADNSWSVSSLNGNYDLNLNGSDQLWILQYGSWSTSGSQRGEYSGNVLYGWTATGWAGDAGHGSHGTTKYSALFPTGECFSTNVVNTSNNDKVKYTGPVTSASRREWITRINDTANWTGYASNTNYVNGGYDYISGYSISITNASYGDGVWLGDTDSNWFNCGNWSNLIVPDENSVVSISDDAQRACVISTTAAYSDDYQDTASCYSLTLSDSSLALADAQAVLKVENDIQLTGGTLSLNAGSIHLKGNWNNSSASAFNTGSGRVKLNGQAKQYLGNSSGDEVFSTLEIDNAHNVELTGALMVGHLKLSTGKLEIDNFEVSVVDSLTGFSSSSYIAMQNDTTSDGYLIMNVSTQEKVFPIGTSSSYTPFTLSLNSGSADFKAKTFAHLFAQGTKGDTLYGERLKHSWHILPVGNGSYVADLTLQWNLSDQTSGFSALHTDAVMMQNDGNGSATDASDWNLLGGSATVNGLNPYTLKATGLNSFGSFSVGVRCAINKPVTSKIYHY